MLNTWVQANCRVHAMVCAKLRKLYSLMTVETRFLKGNILVVYLTNMCAIKPLKQQKSQVDSICVLRYNTGAGVLLQLPTTC